MRSKSLLVSDRMAENRVLANLFLREKPTLILLGMKTSKEKPIYATILSKVSNCTYSHTIKILNLFEKLGVVQFEKSGRIKRVSLTDNGWDIAHNLEAITKKFTQIEEAAEERKKKK